MKVGKGCVVLDTARVVGNVVLAEDVFVLYGAVLRGDAGSIEVGPRSNIQDNAVVHADEPFPARIGADVSVGHGAVVHGCTIGEGTIVGINSVVLNGARVGKGCIIGAGAVVPENAVIPNYSLAVGVPARVVRTNEAFYQRGMLNAAVYQKLKTEYAADDVHRVWRGSKL